MENIIHFIQTFWTLLQQGHLPEVGRWNYLLLGLLVALEGPIVTLLGAAAASAGMMRVGGVFLAASLGNLTADTLWYLLGYTGKVETALRLGHWMGLRRNHIEHLTNAMQKHGPKILFLAKLTAGFMIPSLIAAGLVRLPWKKWFPALMLADTIWTGSLIVIGYFTTEAIKVVAKEVTYIILGMSVLFLILLVWEGRHLLMKDPEFNEAIHSPEDENDPDKK